MAIVTRPKFKLSCKDAMRSQGEWLADLVSEREPNNGGTVQVGWALFKFMDVHSELWLCEPDFSGDPFRDFRADVSASLEVLKGQIDMLKRVRIDGVELRFDDKVVVHRGCLGRKRIYAQRSASKTGDSGWYIGPAEGQSGPPSIEDLEAIRVYQLIALRPEVLSALCLPVGWLVVWNGDQIEGVIDENNLQRYEDFS